MSDYSPPPPTVPPGVPGSPGSLGPAGPELPPPGFPPYGGNPYAVPYPPPYPMGGYGPPDPADRRPGVVVAAAVIGYVLAGMLIFIGLLLVFGASVAHGIETDDHSNTHFGTELFLDATLDLVIGGLLIAGAVTITGRRASGRILYTVGAGLTLGAAVYWATRWLSDLGGFLFYPVFFGVVAIVGVALLWTPDVGAWLRRKRG